jgi:hypothetical protein
VNPLEFVLRSFAAGAVIGLPAAMANFAPFLARSPSLLGVVGFIAGAVSSCVFLFGLDDLSGAVVFVSLWMSLLIARVFSKIPTAKSRWGANGEQSPAPSRSNDAS